MSITWDLEAESDDIFETHYQEQIEHVVADSARLFQYWITESGVEGVYTRSSYAFYHHLTVLRRLFEYGEPLCGILDHLLMQSIQTKWPIGGCPWIFDMPTEYNMAVSQIDWIFDVVGRYLSTQSTGILESIEPRRFYVYQPSLQIIHDIVVMLNCK
jgi:hypothetical protein